MYLLFNCLPPKSRLKLLCLFSRNVQIVPQDCLLQRSRLSIAKGGVDVFQQEFIYLEDREVEVEKTCLFIYFF